MSLTLSDNRGTKDRQVDWPRTLPEDVFHTGQLSYKVKGSYKYHPMWGVLRFESAMGPKRLELYELDTREKCFLINANIYPTTTIPFTQLLGLHPEYTIRFGTFPIQVLTTCKKYHLATKTKEEQQKWLTKFNTLLYGSPRPNRTYEYMVMVFPTKLSNEMDLRGSYIFRVTENSVHLISRDTSDHMTYKIPLRTIVKTSHTVFSNSSIQFAPYSDRKSNIKVLALTIDSDCELKKGGYVFAATSAAEIVTVINERRAKSCNCSQRPNHIPIQRSPTPENGTLIARTENQLTVPNKLPSPNSALSTEVKCSSLTLPLTLASPPSTIPRNQTMPSRNTRISNRESPTNLSTLADAISPVPKVPNSMEKLKENKYKNTKDKTSEDHKKPENHLPKTLNSTHHPKRKFQIYTQVGTLGKDVTNSLTSLTSHKHYENDSDQKLKPAAIRSLQSFSLQRVSSEPAISPEIMQHTNSRFDPYADQVTVVIGDDVDDDNASTTSSSSSHDYDDIINKPSPEQSPTCSLQVSQKLTSPYINLACLVSKEHQWDEQSPHEESFHKSHQQELMAAVTSSKLLKRRSKSMETLVDAANNLSRTSSSSTQTHQSVKINVPEQAMPRLSERHSISHVSKLHTNHHLQHHSKDSLSSRKRSAPSEVIRGTISIKNSRSYESIRCNGPYEQVPKRTLPSVLAVKETVHTIRQQQQYSSPPTPVTRTSAKLGTNTAAQVTTEEGYKRIKNSGPYETAHCGHDNHLNQIRSPSPHTQDAKGVAKPIPRARRKKLQQFASVMNNLTEQGNYESIPNTSDNILGVLSKRSGSMDDLLDIRDISEMYPAHSGKRQDNKSTRISKSAQPTPNNPNPLMDFSELHQRCEHHIINLQSPEDKPNTSPQALPYAMVWLDRL